MNVRTPIFVLLTALALAAQPPPPGRGPAPPPGGPPPPGGREAVQRRLADAKPADATGKNILALAKVYLARSEQERSSPFAATRFLVAADALSQAVEHQQHLFQKGGPPPPGRAELTRHLERVYFRLQQADYFVKQSVDPNAETIAGFARRYYQEALRAGADLRTADECAKSAEELMRALESLAQSTAPPPPPPPKPGREKP